MKNSKLVALLLAASVVACAPLGTKSDSKDASSQRTAGQVVDDATITTRVKTALLADPEISGMKIDVDTKEGAVRLKGEIKSLALRRKVESIAKDVPGVKSINNQLVVTGK